MLRQGVSVAWSFRHTPRASITGAPTRMPGSARWNVAMELGHAGFAQGQSCRAQLLEAGGAVTTSARDSEGRHSEGAQLR